MSRRIVALPLAAALALGACGGGVSKEDYAEDLDAVCANLEEQTRKIGEAQAGDAAELSAQLDDLRQAIRDAVERMRDIERPDGEDGEKAERYIDQLEQTLEEELFPALDDLEAAVRTKDRRRIREASERLQAIDEDETQELAEDLGADDCAEDRSV